MMKKIASLLVIVGFFFLWIETAVAFNKNISVPSWLVGVNRSEVESIPWEKFIEHPSWIESLPDYLSLDNPGEDFENEMYRLSNRYVSHNKKRFIPIGIEVHDGKPTILYMTNDPRSRLQQSDDQFGAYFDPMVRNLYYTQWNGRKWTDLNGERGAQQITDVHPDKLQKYYKRVQQYFDEQIPSDEISKEFREKANSEDGERLKIFNLNGQDDVTIHRQGGELFFIWNGIHGDILGTKWNGSAMVGLDNDTENTLTVLGSGPVEYRETAGRRSVSNIRFVHFFNINGELYGLRFKSYYSNDKEEPRPMESVSIVKLTKEGWTEALPQTQTKLESLLLGKHLWRKQKIEQNYKERIIYDPLKIPLMFYEEGLSKGKSGSVFIIVPNDKANDFTIVSHENIPQSDQTSIDVTSYQGGVLEYAVRQKQGQRWQPKQWCVKNISSPLEIEEGCGVRVRQQKAWHEIISQEEKITSAVFLGIILLLIIVGLSARPLSRR